MNYESLIREDLEKLKQIRKKQKLVRDEKRIQFLILLKPHASFLKPLDKLLDSGKIKGLAHITGGGLLENIPRVLPENVAVEINRGTWTELPVFGLMQKLGNVETGEMFRAFNMGVGMVVICAEADKDFLKNNFGECVEIGRVIEGVREVFIIT